MWIGLTLYPRNPYAIQTEQKKDIHKHVTDWTKASQKPKCHGINNSTRFTVTITICAASQTEGELLIGNTSGFFFIFLANYHLSLYFCLPYNIITMLCKVQDMFNRPPTKGLSNSAGHVGWNRYADILLVYFSFNWSWKQKTAKVLVF